MIVEPLTSWNPDHFGEGADPNEPPDPDDLIEKAKWLVGDTVYGKSRLSSGEVLQVTDDGILIKWTRLYKTSSRKNKKPVNQVTETFYDWDAVREWNLIPWRLLQEIDSDYAAGTLVLISYGRGNSPVHTGVIVDNNCYPFIDVHRHGDTGSDRLHYSKLQRIPPSQPLCWLEPPFVDCSLKVGDRVRVAHAVFNNPCLKQNGTIKGFLTEGTHLQLSAVVECDNGHSTTVFVRWLVPVSEATEAAMESGLEISFGYTKDEILAGVKTCTRRDWKDSHAAKFIKAYEQGLKIRAIDKDRRAGGKQIGWLTLTQRPYQQHIGAMTEADLKAEGGMCSTVDEFAGRYFKGDLKKRVWVIWFEFEPMPEQVPSSYKGFTVGDRVIEDGNNSEWGDKHQLQSLIKRGQILSFKAIPGCNASELHPFIHYEDGSEGFGVWDCLKVDDHAPEPSPKPSTNWTRESAQAFEEVVKAFSGQDSGTNQCQENKEAQEQHTTRAKTQNTLTQNQDWQEPTGNCINKDSVSRKLPECMEGHEQASTTYSNPTDTNSDPKRTSHTLCSTEANTPLNQAAILPEQTENAHFSIETLGSITTEQSQTNGMFIISTETSKTIDQRTWNASQKENTPSDTVAKKNTEQDQLGGLIQERFLSQRPTPPSSLESQTAPFTQPSEQVANVENPDGSGLECLQCSMNLQVSGAQQSQETGSASKQPSLSKSTQTHKESLGTTIQIPQFTTISEPTTQDPENTISIGIHSPARAHQALVLGLDSITPNPVFGLKPCDASSRGVQTLWLLKTLKVLSTEDYGKFLADCEWQAIRGTIRSSYRQLGSELLTRETDSSLLPTPTSYAEGSDTHRPAGTNKLERTLRLLPTVTASQATAPDTSKGGNRLERSLLPTPVARDGKGPTGTPNESLNDPIQEYLTGTDKMNPKVPGWMMGFQPGYVEEILMDGGATITLPDTQEFPIEPQGDEPASSSTAELSCPNKPRSHSVESSTSTQSLETNMIVTEQNASDVVCPHVLVIGERTHPYQLPKCDRFPIIRTTAKKLWCETPDGEKLFDQAKVYCIAGDSEWNQFEEHYHNFQGALDELAHALQQLGSYKSQLEAQGGMKKAPNPLSPTVIAIDDPDYEQSMTLYETWGIPEIKRRRVNRHTPQMLKTAPPDEHPEWGEHCQAQHNNFVCPSDEDWERISQLHAAALQDSQKLIRHLESLGIYAETATRADLAQNVTPQIEEHSSEQNDASEERRWWVGDLLIGANQTGTVTEAIDKEVQVQWVNSKGGICNELYPRRQLKYLSEFEYREQFSVGDRAEALVPIPFGAIPTFTERLKTEIGELGTIIKVMDTGLCVTWDVGETVYSIDPTQVKRLEPIAWKESDRIWHGTPDNQGEVLEDLGEGVYKIKLDGKPEPFLVDRETIHPIYSQAVVPSSIDRYLERNSEPVLDSYPKEEWLNPGLIVLDCGTQSRPFEFDQERLDDYAEAMKTGDWEMERHPLPEVCLAEDGLYYAVDCHHRAQAGAIALPPGQQMLFLVRKGTLAQARIWSAAANTMHGLAADNSPKGVRKRVEMFLENIEELDTDAYQAEFEKVPDLTEQERRHGKFSSRTIARYLRLRPGQDRTVSNIIKEREMAAKISRFEVSDRIEVISPDGERLPDWLSVGDLGTIKSKDRKTGLWVKWDKRPSDAPFPINPDFAQKTDKPFVPVAPVTAPPVQQPPKPTINKSSIPTPMAVTASTSDEVGSVTFTAAGTKERVLRDQERNEDRTAQENPTPSPVTNLRVFQQWSKVQVVIGVHEGRTGAISSFPAPGFAIVALDATDDAQATRERFKESELELIHHSHEQKAASDVDLKVATRTVVENLHRLLPDELEALESAIAAFKSNWRAAS